jgi:FkbM family methyltransferase
MKTDQIKEIYSLLGDDKSRCIFENRLMYSLTKEPRFIRNTVCTIEIGAEIYNRLKESHRPKILFGAGSVGKRLVRIYDDLKFTCFVDNSRAGGTCEGIPVISLQKMKEKYPEALVIIATNKYHREIRSQLEREGIEEKNIVNIGMEYEKLNHLQYFDLPQLEERKAEREVFVDGGCYDGSTSVDFVNWCLQSETVKERYVYAWEPSAENLEMCSCTLTRCNAEYKLIPRGLWSEEKELTFSISGGSTRISNGGTIKIQVDNIDHMVKEPATFIKMDIEGSEYEALCGAKNMIREYKPKLAICIYHKPEDIWELPWLIYELNTEYRFYLRHYSFGDVETVLYAL